MSGRTFVLILFFWAVLTVVTPTLVRWSASAKPHAAFKAKGETREEMHTKRVLELLPRRALVPTTLQKATLAREPAPSPAHAQAQAQAPAPAREPTPSPASAQAPAPEHLLVSKCIQIL